MSEYSIVDEALQLGGVCASAVDLATGELLEVAPLPGREEDSAQRSKPPSEGFPVAGGPLPGRNRAGVSPGLSKAHICTQSGNVAFYVGGSLLSCSKPKANNEQVGGGKRGKVTGFSKASRRRMLYTVGKIERARLPMMVTLTYPAEWPGEGATWKNHLRRWWQRLKRRLPGVGGIWKLEPQKRGAPHFHLLIWGLEGVPKAELRAWVSRSWYQVVGSGDLKHLAAGTRVEQVTSRRGVLAYATKYLGKMNEAGQQGWDEPGRFWGVKSANNIPWAELISCAVTFRQAVKLLRLMRRAMHCRRGNLPGLTMLSNNPDHWFLRFEELVT